MSDCANMDEEVTRYIHDSATAEERIRVKKHLASCRDCSEEVRFSQELNRVLKNQPPGSDDPGEPCPDVDLIVALDADELESVTAQNVRAHILRCRSCRDEYLGFSRLTEMKFEEKVIAEDDRQRAKRWVLMQRRPIAPKLISEHPQTIVRPPRPKRFD